MTKILYCIAVLCLFFSAIGCGPAGRGLQVEYVEGIVTLDGVPLADADVSFSPATDTEGMEGAMGMTNASGKYTLSSLNGDLGRGAVAGEYTVSVLKIVSVVVREADPVRGIPEDYEAVYVSPEIYRDKSTSPLRATVNKGKNKIDLELKNTP